MCVRLVHHRIQMHWRPSIEAALDLAVASRSAALNANCEAIGGGERGPAGSVIVGRFARGANGVGSRFLARRSGFCRSGLTVCRHGRAREDSSPEQLPTVEAAVRDGRVGAAGLLRPCRSAAGHGMTAETASGAASTIGCCVVISRLENIGWCHLPRLGALQRGLLRCTAVR